MQTSYVTGAPLSMMRIGEVAERAGVNVQTLRYYERRGLLPRPTRRPSGHREYQPDSVALVRFIKRAQHLGFSLEDIGEILELRQHPRRNALAVRAVAIRRAADIADRIRRLKAMQNALEQLVRACECAGTSRSCAIIEALDEESAAPHQV
jgi:DNA-binding transcriptional MerR regulator